MTASAHDYRRFLLWLDHQGDRDDDTGALARAHRAGDIDLTWPDAAGQPTSVRAAMILAREQFDALDGIGVIRADGTLNERRARRHIGA